MTELPRADLPRLVAEGKSDTDLAALFKVTTRTILRWRQADNLPSAWVKPKTAKHGTRSRYVHDKCRCDLCRAAARNHNTERRRRGDAPHHGTTSGYVNFGCRCDLCKEAGSLRNQGQDDYHRDWAKTLNEASRAEADRWGYYWTGPELELISRPDLTAPQCAKLLGRTVAAVRNQRAHLNASIPKKLRTRGLVGDDAPH